MKIKKLIYCLIIPFLYGLSFMLGVITALWLFLILRGM
jgi:hypothetical protein